MSVLEGGNLFSSRKSPDSFNYFSLGLGSAMIICGGFLFSTCAGSKTSSFESILFSVTVSRSTLFSFWLPAFELVLCSGFRIISSGRCGYCYAKVLIEISPLKVFFGFLLELWVSLSSYALDLFLTIVLLNLVEDVAWRLNLWSYGNLVLSL